MIAGGVIVCELIDGVRRFVRLSILLRERIRRTRVFSRVSYRWIEQFGFFTQSSLENFVSGVCSRIGRLTLIHLLSFSSISFCDFVYLICKLGFLSIHTLDLDSHSMTNDDSRRH